MWVNEWGWQAEGSFPNPRVPPNAEPGDSPQLQVCFNQEYLTIILGALSQLVQPSTWVSSDRAHLVDILSSMTDLMALFGNAGPCEMFRVQLDSACGLQFSLDGGSTWSEVPGWDTYIASCVKAWIPPQTPPNPMGNLPNQNACNIAGFLANQTIQASVADITAGINASHSQEQIISGITGAIPGMGVFLGPATNAAFQLYEAILGPNLNDFTSAAADVNLWSAVTCAIYNAIKAQGGVTPSNFQAAADAIGMLTYVHTEVPPALEAYWLNMGLEIIQMAQSVGAINVVDCTNCGNWCQQYNFPTDIGHFTFPYQSGGGQLCGQGICGTEVNIGTPSVYNGIEIAITFSPAVYLTAAKCWVFADGGSNPNVGPGAIIARYQGNVVATNAFDDGATPLAGHEQALSPIDSLVDLLIFAFRRDTGRNVWMSSVGLEGHGVNPFGVDNCTY